jgi:rubrerythrin
MSQVAVMTANCPKCRRPLEGDEVYICCGTSEIQWRCNDCRKVSEGFAFPYGMCPLCNGKLELLDPRALGGEGEMNAIQMAFEIELGGLAFYTRASEEVEDPTLKDLFGRLAEMEEEHMETLCNRYHADVPDVSDKFAVERAAINAGIGSRPDDPANLFRVAIAFEERAVAFFSERGQKAANGTQERELYLELAAEEREHVALLGTEFERWKEGKPGIL